MSFIKSLLIINLFLFVVYADNSLDKEIEGNIKNAVEKYGDSFHLIVSDSFVKDKRNIDSSLIKLISSDNINMSRSIIRILDRRGSKSVLIDQAITQLCLDMFKIKNKNKSLSHVSFYNVIFHYFYSRDEETTEKFIREARLKDWFFTFKTDYAEISYLRNIGNSKTALGFKLVEEYLKSPLSKLNNSSRKYIARDLERLKTKYLKEKELLNIIFSRLEQKHNTDLREAKDLEKYLIDFISYKEDADILDCVLQLAWKRKFEGKSKPSIDLLNLIIERINNLKTIPIEKWNKQFIEKVMYFIPSYCKDEDELLVLKSFDKELLFSNVFLIKMAFSWKWSLSPKIDDFINSYLTSNDFLDETIRKELLSVLSYREKRRLRIEQETEKKRQEKEKRILYFQNKKQAK